MIFNHKPNKYILAYLNKLSNIKLVTNCHRLVISILENTTCRIISIMNNQYSNLLSTLYPVGSIYIGTQSTCPLAALIAGSTWQIVSNGRALWGGDGTNANSTIEAGLPNIIGDFSPMGLATVANSDGCFSTISSIVTDYESAVRQGYGARIRFNAALSSGIYGRSSTVQPDAYIVNVWRRTA